MARLIPAILFTLFFAAAFAVLMYRMRYFLAWYGGSNRVILDQCSEVTKERRKDAGLILMGFVLFSSVCAGLAWYQTSGKMDVGLGVGIGWFIMFSALDNRLMASLDGRTFPRRAQAETNKSYYWRVAVAVVNSILAYGLRMVLAALTAYVNTAVVLNVVFHDDIEKKIAARAGQHLAPAIKKVEEARDAYAKMDTAWNTWLVEEKNTRQVLIDRGDTARADEVKANIERREADYLRIRKEGVEASNLRLAEAGLAKARAEAEASTGIRERKEILDEMAQTNTIIRAFYWIIFVLELGAFIAKLWLGKDEYDTKLSDYQEWAKTARYEPPATRPPPAQMNPTGFEDTQPPSADVIRFNASRPD